MLDCQVDPSVRNTSLNMTKGCSATYAAIAGPTLNKSGAGSTAFYSLTLHSGICGSLCRSFIPVFELQGSIAQFKDLSIAGTSIEINNPLSTSTITLSPGVDGVVQVEGAFRLENVSPVVSTPNYTGIYSTSTVGGGGTGVYFVNTQQTDELVSRRRSIVYSIIF
jgi:hypothetical protein